MKSPPPFPGIIPSILAVPVWPEPGETQWGREIKWWGVEWPLVRGRREERDQDIQLVPVISYFTSTLVGLKMVCFTRSQ